MKRVLVTGGGSGIGREVAHRFAAAGNNVTICGRRLEALEQTAADHNNIDIRTADITDESQVDALFDKPFDIVIANAGVAYASKLQNTTLAMWNETIAATLTGVFLTFRAAVRDIPEGGRMIAIASVASLRGTPNTVAYSAAKHGVLGIVRSTALEVAKHGVTCNAICPGYVDTPMAQSAVDNVMRRFEVSREEATAKVVARNPMGRMITVQEVAGAAVYLASDEAAIVNGHALSLSGGEI